MMLKSGMVLFQNIYIKQLFQTEEHFYIFKIRYLLLPLFNIKLTKPDNKNTGYINKA